MYSIYPIVPIKKSDPPKRYSNGYFYNHESARAFVEGKSKKVTAPFWKKGAGC